MKIGKVLYEKDIYVTSTSAKDLIETPMEDNWAQNILNDQKSGNYL